MLTALRNRITRIIMRLGFRRDWYLIVLAAGIGTITACGAIGFIELLHAAERWSESLSARLPSSPIPFLLPLIPMVGALLTGLLVFFFAREARGHGVPEVMDAIYRKKSRIRPRVALVKSVASACTIGSGGSAGAEGPIVQIGSALGSGLSQLLKTSREDAATLLGCGAAAGIASVFNAPIAGVFFVLEILLRDFSLRTFTPIVVAAVFSTATTQAYYGQNDAIFAISGTLTNYTFSFSELPSYIVLGLVCAAVAVLFIRALYYTEDLYEKLKLHPIIKPVTGALLLGVLGIVFMVSVDPQHYARHIPPFFGNGYETIRGLLQPASYAAVPADLAAPAPNAAGVSVEHNHLFLPIHTGFWFLLAIAACKLIATCFTLGSGGSGGVFAPSLFLGAATGAIFGIILQKLGLLPTDGSPAAYALVGMAAVVAGATHAPLTAILILFEITRDVYVLLPIMLAAVVSTVGAQLLLRDSIYSLKLRRRGVLVGSAADLTILRKLTARDITPVPHVQVRVKDPLSRLLELRDVYQITDFVVIDEDGLYVGLVTNQDLRTALIEREAIPYLLVEELLRRDLPRIHPEDTLDSVLEKFSRNDISSLPLVEPDDDSKVSGLITRSRLMRRYQQALADS